MLSVNKSQLPDISSLSISSMSDYHNFDFPGKDAQREAVLDLIDQQGFIPDDVVEHEVEWLYDALGIDDLFFSKESPEMIANIIHTLYAAKIESFARINIAGDTSDESATPLAAAEAAVAAAAVTEAKPTGFSVKTQVVTDGHSVFMETGHELDEQIDSMLLDSPDHRYRLISYTAENALKLTFVYRTAFAQGSPAYPTLTSEQLSNGDIDSISDVTMSQVTSNENKRLYGLIMDQMRQREGPIIKTMHSVADQDEVRIVIGFKRGTTKSYYTALSSLLQYYDLKPSKIYLETFANDVMIYSLYLKQSQQTEKVLNSLPMSILQIEREASLLYAIPSNFFQDLYQQKSFSPQEAIYAHIGSIFINNFINRLGEEYQDLIGQVNTSFSSNNNSMLEVLASLKKKLRNETYTQQMIIEVLHKYKDIVSKLYKNFAQVHYVSSMSTKFGKTLSYQRLSKLEPFEDDNEFEQYVNKFIPNDSPDMLILQTLATFNKAILKTNFFMTRKVAISFRLDPALIMPKVEFPETPFGIFFVVGNTFKAFHIRFRDIARGGIRIVCSKTQDIYEVNSRMAIDENYQLASTQQRKNKDIPEGGSKGVILLNPTLTTQQQTFVAFSQYVDAIIDILIQDPLKEKYVDLLKQEEILFFGPDEGTAGFVNWATSHAKSRGCPWWKSFLTGKSPTMGGIPHDVYGMTSLSVRAFVNALYETLGLQETTINKFQTGGPDGDLGSNEILLSSVNERYIGLVDGSGVLCDPKGLDQDELRRLAVERKMSSFYNKSKLSNEGFFVSVDEIEVQLPNGVTVANGTTFRNKFHLEIFKFVDKVDLFVPCGGRPNSIDINVLKYFVDEKTNKCKIPYIVEGANLFITQPAKIALENLGCVLFKDASTNKGGVTSSSMEVLASLALNDHDFIHEFVAKESNKTTALYDNYVQIIQDRVVKNARAEFAQLWQLNQATGTPISELSNVLSQTINKLNDELIISNELWANDLELRNYLLLKKIIPKLLIDVAGPSNILENIPESYLKALLSSYLSSTYVYTYGIDVNIGKFLEYVGELKREAKGFN
ncbi:LANO_0H03906g1_1 [Lachancea nothofagi CBS 11611]|uniref:NAD-specific glutamate dehydrogenase n=1 Tax=Lachancea nothofagi CBS 11611 TaxID=1266666 RepID=A0A1G4KLB3_9SACH|nr:LANO_0H03906g1_1 [Lachancea nothofagi CBS 11611]